MQSSLQHVESIVCAFIGLRNLDGILFLSRKYPSGRLRLDPMAAWDWRKLRVGLPFPLLDKLEEDLAAARKVVGQVDRRPSETHVATVRIGDHTGIQMWPTAVDHLLDVGDEIVTLLTDLRREHPKPAAGRTRIASERIDELLLQIRANDFQSELTLEIRALRRHGEETVDADSAATSQITDCESTANLVDRALLYCARALREGRKPSIKKLAEELGVTRQALYENQALDEVRTSVKSFGLFAPAGNGNARRGTKRNGIADAETRDHYDE